MPIERTFASFYDFYDPAEYRKDQLDAYARLASDAGGTVLELACGTGTISLELARRGVEVTGLDISRDVLDVFRAKLESEEEAVRRRVTLVEGDMKDLASCSFDGRFDAVLIPNNSFGYLTSTEDQKRCLLAVGDNLVEGGSVVIEERLYTPEVLTAMLAKRNVPLTQMQRIHPETGLVTSFHSVTVHIDVARQTILWRRYIEELQFDGSIRRIVPEGGGLTRNRYFTRFEIQLLLEQAGFEVRDIWGGYDRRPFTATSRSMIFTGRTGGAG